MYEKVFELRPESYLVRNDLLLRTDIKLNSPFISYIPYQIHTSRIQQWPTHGTNKHVTLVNIHFSTWYSFSK